MESKKNKKTNAQKSDSLVVGFMFALLLLVIVLHCTGCATSTTRFERISENEYIVSQKGQADVQVNEKGVVTITNPKSTLAGLWENMKEVLYAIGGRLQTTKEIE